MTDPIVRTEFSLALPSGERRTVTLCIGQPYRASTGEWRCPIALEGLQDRLADAAGEDAFQSLSLALRLLMSQLEAVVQRGGKVFYPNSELEVPLEAYVQSGISLGRPA